MQPIFGVHRTVEPDPPFQASEKRRQAGLRELERVQEAQVQRHDIAERGHPLAERSGSGEGGVAASSEDPAPPMALFFPKNSSRPPPPLLRLCEAGQRLMSEMAADGQFLAASGQIAMATNTRCSFLTPRRCVYINHDIGRGHRRRPASGGLMSCCRRVRRISTACYPTRFTPIERAVSAASSAGAFAFAFAACGGDASDCATNIPEVRVTDGAVTGNRTTAETGAS